MRPIPFALLCFVVLALPLARDTPALYALSARGMQTTGVVTRTECEKHASYFVQIQVSSRQFEVADRDGARQFCNALRAGDATTIYYLPDDPSVTIGREPVRELWESLAWALGVPFLFGCIAYFVASRSKNKRTHSQSSAGRRKSPQHR